MVWWAARVGNKVSPVFAPISTGPHTPVLKSARADLLVEVGG